MKKILFALAIVALLCATAQAADVTLQWDSNSEADLAGYRVYYGTAPMTYIQPKGSGLDAGLQTTYTVTGLTKGPTYYFAVTAYDSETPQNESDYSNEVFTNLGPNAPQNNRVKVIVEVTVP